MGKIVKQFRYYGEAGETRRGLPSSNITKAGLISGEGFFDNADNVSITSIASICIQTVPGVKFFLNASPMPIIIGSTGIYNLPLVDKYEINRISFEPESLQLVDSFGTNSYLIIDIIYNTRE